MEIATDENIPFPMDADREIIAQAEYVCRVTAPALVEENNKMRNALLFIAYQNCLTRDDMRESARTALRSAGIDQDQA